MCLAATAPLFLRRLGEMRAMGIRGLLIYCSD
jgi:hypothetical protein